MTAEKNERQIMLELKLAQSRHCCVAGRKEVETKAKVLFSFPRLNISRPTIAHLRYKHQHSFEPASKFIRKKAWRKIKFAFNLRQQNMN